MLGVARRDDKEPMNRDRAGVPDRVRRPARNENEVAASRGYLAAAEHEYCLSFCEVERLIGVRVEVKGTCGFARREDSNDRDVGSCHLRRTEMGWLGRAD